MNEPRYPYVQLQVTLEELELAYATLWELGVLGIEERDATTFTRAQVPDGQRALLVCMADDGAAAQLIDALPARWDPTLTHVVGDDWRTAWKEYFKPTRVGERLVVRPSWEPYTSEPGDLVITLDPENAFGTGAHDTTRLALMAIERRMSRHEPLSPILDVGCGSGILSIACVLHGASHVHAIDVDEHAVATAEKNAALNGVAERIRFGTEPVGELQDSFPLVVANIETRVLVPLAPEIGARVQPGGHLLLTGILDHEPDQVLAAYPDFTCLGRPQLGEWVLLELQRPA